MAQLKKILFYSDSNTYGGHEIMSVKIANFLASSHNYKIGFMFHHNKISSNLNDKIIPYFNPYCDKTPFPFIRNLNFFKIFSIKKRMKKINPDIIIVCQGTIELSLKGLIAARLSKIYTISYIK